MADIRREVLDVMNMDWSVIVVFGFPLIMTVCGMGYAAFQGYLKHKERMAMIASGLLPEDWKDEATLERSKSPSTSTGIIVTLVGVAITVGLSTIGIGPWLIGGLVPTAVGCAMLISEVINAAKNNKKSE